MPKPRYKLIAEVYLVITNNHNQILLSKRLNTGYEDGKYSFIAGHVEENESLTQAIIRESREEAGIVINPQNLKLLHVMHRNKEKTTDEERIGFFFTTNKWHGQIVNCEPQKCSEIAWFTFNNLPSNIIPYIRQAINCFHKKINFSEFAW